jgi:hypothetical protein
VEADNIHLTPFELGNRKQLQIRIWYFNVFAQNKAQRDEYAYRLMNALQDSIAVYDYDQGFPPTVVTKLGALIPTDIDLQMIKIYSDLTESLYYRSVIKYISEYSEV